MLVSMFVSMSPMQSIFLLDSITIFCVNMYSILNRNMLMLVNLKLKQMVNSLRGLSSSNNSGTVNPWDSHVQEPAMWETRPSWDQLLGRSMDVLHIVWIYSPRRLQP